MEERRLPTLPARARTNPSTIPPSQPGHKPRICTHSNATSTVITLGKPKLLPARAFEAHSKRRLHSFLPGNRSSPLRLDPQALPDSASHLPLHPAHTVHTAHHLTSNSNSVLHRSPPSSPNKVPIYLSRSQVPRWGVQMQTHGVGVWTEVLVAG